MDEEQVPSKHFLPFPVLPCQRRTLQRHKAKAVAKEAELVARKKRQLEELKVYIHQAINEKNNKPREPAQKVSGSGQARLDSDDSPDRLQTKVDRVPSCMNAAKRKHRSPRSLLGGMVKGFLTRKLFHSNKVQLTVTTIKDALRVLATLVDPTAKADRELKQRMQTQLSVARLTLHEIFFQLSPAEQMAYISHSRTLRQLKKLSEPKAMQNSTRPANSAIAKVRKVTPPANNGRVPVGGKLSTATIKYMQRRQKANNAAATSNM